MFVLDDLLLHFEIINIIDTTAKIITIKLVIEISDHPSILCVLKLSSKLLSLLEFSWSVMALFDSSYVSSLVSLLIFCVIIVQYQMQMCFLFSQWLSP